MADQDQAPKLGATFLPGGLDDFYMPAAPDVVSPAPQRKMAELPDQIQQGLASLELQASPSLSQVGGSRLPAAGMPDFSLFPVLTQRTPNIPPPDAEKEAVLENARVNVISSSDPEVQLMWANDALVYVDISARYERRMSQLFGSRPPTPPAEIQMRADALGIVDFLAGQGHPRAEFMKAMWLEFGQFGYREDKPEAFRTYKRAADKGYARAEYRMGMLFESTYQPMEALQHYKAGEKVGDSAACYRLGMAHLLGQLGQPQDFPVAVQLIKHSAEHADENAPQGAYVYGMLLANELPQVTVPATILQPDPAASRVHLERSAFLGFSKAQIKMGSAYELCSLGCPFNPTLSLHYNRLAARQAEAEAEMAISKWFLCGSTGIFGKSDAMAYHFAERAASDGLDTAEFAMGYFHEVGISCAISIDTALQWYRKAAASGSADATARLNALTLSKQNTLKKSDHERVAIERIRSTHASKRGHRPERLANAGQNMPPMPAIPVPQSYARRSSAHAAPPPVPEGSRPVSAMSLAPRSSSVAPYPLDDRPSTVVPYPLGDTMRQANPAQRPVSTAVDGRARPPGPSQQIPAAAAQRVSGLRQSSGGAPPARPPKELAPPQIDGRYGSPADIRRATRTPDFSGRPGGPQTPERTPPRAQQHQQRLLPGHQGPVAGTQEGRRSSAPSSGPLPPPRPKPVTAAGQKAPVAVVSRPPGKGPQTFEQMGIPAGKTDSDCVVM